MLDTLIRLKPRHPHVCEFPIIIVISSIYPKKKKIPCMHQHHPSQIIWIKDLVVGRLDLHDLVFGK